jgi:hypothetical protein
VLTLLTISAVSIDKVSTTPSEIVPGNNFEASIEIENIFSYDVENVQVKLDFSTVPFAPYQSSSEKYIDEIKEGDSENFNFRIIALPEADSGIYKIPVNITYEYKDGNLTKSASKTEIISVTLNSVPELSLSLDNSMVLIKGQENKVSFKIVNSGLSNVKFLYLKLDDSSGYRVTSSSEQYIGDIDSNDFDSMEYSIYINANSPSQITFPLTLSFKDSTNKEFNTTQEISLKIYTKSEAQSLGLLKKPSYTIYIILVLLVLAYFVYRIIKKRKSRKN